MQNVVVMRHGDRIDHIQSTWIEHAERPWDPPLVEVGKIRAWKTGKKFRDLGFPIHRVVVSPFRRCLQTAAEVITALCATNEGGVLTGAETSEGIAVDPSRVKVSIEYGLCEIFGRVAIPYNVAPMDGKWFPDVSELEAILPAGTIDHSAERIYATLPNWEESMLDARTRYEQVFVALADKFPEENLLLVTHGEGVGVAVSAFSKNMQAFNVEYCAHVRLQRQTSLDHGGGCTVPAFRVLLEDSVGGRTGISYFKN